MRAMEIKNTGNGGEVYIEENGEKIIFPTEKKAREYINKLEAPQESKEVSSTDAIDTTIDEPKKRGRKKGQYK